MGCQKKNYDFYNARCNPLNDFIFKILCKRVGGKVKVYRLSKAERLAERVLAKKDPRVQQLRERLLLNDTRDNFESGDSKLLADKKRRDTLRRSRPEVITVSPTGLASVEMPEAPKLKTYGAYIDPNKPKRKRTPSTVWRPADNGPGFFYIGCNKPDYAATFTKKMGVCTDADQRLVAHNCPVDWEYDLVIPISNKRSVENLMKAHFHEFKTTSKEKFKLEPEVALGNAKMWAQMIAEEFRPTALQLESFPDWCRS